MNIRPGALVNSAPIIQNICSYCNEQNKISLSIYSRNRIKVLALYKNYFLYTPNYITRNFFIFDKLRLLNINRNRCLRRVHPFIAINLEVLFCRGNVPIDIRDMINLKLLDCYNNVNIKNVYHLDKLYIIINNNIDFDSEHSINTYIINDIRTYNALSEPLHSPEIIKILEYITSYDSLFPYRINCSRGYSNIDTLLRMSTNRINSENRDCIMFITMIIIIIIFVILIILSVIIIVYLDKKIIDFL